jgi:hypothetical protein
VVVVKTILLAASLVANVALAGLLLGAPREAPALRHPNGRPASRQTGTATGYYERLLALGLDEHEARSLLYAVLDEAAAKSVPRPQIRYWQTGLAAAADHRLAVVEAQRQVRAQLNRLFGPAAAQWPEFAHAYRPLDLEFGFLDSASQIALNEWRLRRVSAALSTPAKTTQQGTSQEAASQQAPGSTSPPMLTATDAFEYALRVSPLAEALRRSGVDLTEAEFRSAYRALARAESAPGDLVAQLEARRAVRDALGTQRFERVWAARDPTFEALADAGEQLGLDAAAVESAYSVINDAQERLLALAAQGGLDGARSADVIRGISAEERRGLEDLFGTEAASRLLRARDEKLWALSRQAAQRNHERTAG